MNSKTAKQQNSKTAKQQNSKTRQLVLLMSSVFFLFLFSCEKENFNTSNSSKKKGFKIISYGSGGENSRGVQNNILSFDTEAEFNATLDSLEQEFDKYQLDFQETYKNMSDNDLNNLVNSHHIDLELPLTKFEEEYNFKSLRNSINNKEAIWLNQPNPDFNQCPQLFPIEDHVERTLWNEKGEIMIAGKIYKYDDDDKYIKIDDGDFNKLALINAGDQAVFSSDKVFVQNLDVVVNEGQCVRTSYNTSPFSSSNNDIKLIAANRLRPKTWEFGKHHMYSTTYTYQKINGSYYPLYTEVYAGCLGDRYYGCINTTQTTINKTRRAASVVIDFERANAFSVKFNPSWCSMVSIHSAPEINSLIFPYPFNPVTLRYVY